MKVQDIETTLRLTEIFYSLQGESTYVGLPTVFVRLTGCPLRCQYCDTAYAFSGGSLWTLSQILDEVSTHQTPWVCVTGGEPLAQPQCLILLKQLCEMGYKVSLETSGALDVSLVDPRVCRVMDLKTPDSQESHRNRYENIAFLGKQDQIKFVIGSRNDYEWAKRQMLQWQLQTQVGEVLFSPSHEQLSDRVLADWILQDHLKVRFQTQLHKILWNNQPGH